MSDNELMRLEGVIDDAVWQVLESGLMDADAVRERVEGAIEEFEPPTTPHVGGGPKRPKPEPE